VVLLTSFGKNCFRFAGIIAERFPQGVSFRNPPNGFNPFIAYKASIDSSPLCGRNAKGDGKEHMKRHIGPMIIPLSLAIGSASAQSWTPGSSLLYANPATTRIYIGTNTDPSGYGPTTYPMILARSQTVGTHPVLRIENSNGIDVFTAGKSGQNGIAYINDLDGNAKVQLYSHGDSWFKGGNLGLGTDAPSSPNGRGLSLEINGTNAPGNNTYPGIVMRASSSQASSLNTWEMLLSGNAVSSTYTDYQIMANTTSRICVQGDSKNVGINNGAPTNTLDIQGDADARIRLKSAASGVARLYLSPGDDALTSSLSARADGSMDINTFGNSELTLRGGKVGIGKSVPSAKLDVNGDANISGALTVSSINTHVWSVVPDYVFEREYKLRSLPQVEHFVRTNKHLPEIPSAKEIQEKGLDLAEMNLKLLKKVEELTLYTIELEKRVGQLETRR
jgi:hypothetical protein